MVHEVAVHFIEYVVAVEIVIPRVLEPIRNHVTLVSDGKLVVDVAFINGKILFVAHNEAFHQAVVDDIVNFVDMIGFCRFDVVGNICTFLPVFHRV